MDMYMLPIALCCAAHPCLSLVHVFSFSSATMSWTFNQSSCCSFATLICLGTTSASTEKR